MIRNAFARGERVTAADACWRTRSGDLRDVVLTISPLPDGAVSVFVRDVTDERRLERERRDQADQRARELRFLLDIAHDAAATLEIGPLVALILDRVKTVIDYVGAALFVLDDDGEGLNLLRYQGPIPQHLLTWRWSLTQHLHAGEVIRTARPVIIADVFGEAPLADSWRRNAAPGFGDARHQFGSWMGAPLMLGERVTGMLSVETPRVDAYTERDAELLSAVADQAAVAIENARLYEQARGIAALEERQKLARELHDSVSQALFGIGLGARTARALVERDPARAIEPLDYVVSLAEAGLTEMRALIFALRPDALETEGLIGLLEQQAAALRARHRLTVETEFDAEPDISLPAKEALFRIAQEALHNIVKHADATAVRLCVAQMEEGVRLEISDNGAGFNPGATFAGHLGLRSMRERAARQGAQLEIASAPAAGATIRLLLPPVR
jgi:signal transduction histidine kinase